ncbi:Cactin [Porphyridium purpureum]|uniref:Splicing factor Cactin n=1 Tax=Porphyridium purpureum TaxID=35688 RepID=A0A5J4Z4X4_PORPP|nr:Cactin [Porphyridium purpureum]|eukprot:POR2009..scf295_1
MSSFLPEESDKHYEMSSSGAQNEPLDILDPGQTVRPKLVSPVESSVGLADLETNVKISQEPPLSASLGHEQNGYDLVDVVEPGSDVFVWRKREKALAKHGPDGQRLGSAANDASRYELLREFEEAKRARERRELERAEKKREQMQQNRLEEQERNKEWEEQEEAFHAKQFFDRQKIRIQERRATLADVIANNLRLLESPLEIRYESKSVRDHLRASTFVELQTLVPEIKRALYYSVRAPVIDSGEVPRDFFISRDERVQFWKDVEVMVVAELKVKDSNASPEAHTAQLEEKPSTGPSDLPLYGFEPDICRAVATACEDSNGETLRAYVCELIGRGKIPNPAFWEHVLEQIDVAAAQSRINSLYERVRVEYQRIMDAIPASEKMASNAAKQEQLTTPYDESAELANLLREEREKGMEQDEEMYANEAAVERVWRSWHDKHTPRKPRYFNRVHLGYDWNKYNQMHYDKTNPPPKTVKGYKFNIFYPDLLDKGQTPTFQIHDTDHPDISIITFYAGAPYEPVAFKIARRPWEYSHKRGYKCTFERGVLRLWFSFQRMRYRR